MVVSKSRSLIHDFTLGVLVIQYLLQTPQLSPIMHEAHTFDCYLTHGFPCHTLLSRDLISLKTCKEDTKHYMKVLYSEPLYTLDTLQYLY